MPTVDDVLTTVASGETTRPRLTHYSPDGRIELSGRVLLNWVSKAVNCLQEEFDVSVGARVGLDLPAGHWRTAYWALAVWQVGATLVVRENGASDDVDVWIAPTSSFVTAKAAASRPTHSVAVTLAPLARKADRPLPGGVLDEAAELSTYGDVAVAWEEPAGNDVALDAGGHVVDYADLVPLSPDLGGRVLMSSPEDLTRWVRDVAAVWAGDGSVVVVTDDAADVARIASDEQITVRL